MALVFGGVVFGGLSLLHANAGDTNVSLQNILAAAAAKVPELGVIGSIYEITPSGQVWHGEKSVSGEFLLRKNPRFHPWAAAPVPFVDMSATIARYASVGDTQNELPKGLLRNQAYRSKESYRGAALYRWVDSTGGTSTVVCQSGRYIIEIDSYSDDARPLIMKLLDVVLAGIASEPDPKKLWLTGSAVGAT